MDKNQTPVSEVPATDSSEQAPATPDTAPESAPEGAPESAPEGEQPASEGEQPSA